MNTDEIKALKDRFTIIPNELWQLGAHLEPEERSIYPYVIGVYCCLASCSDTFDPGLRHIQKKIGFSRPTIEKAIEFMVGNGMLRIENEVWLWPEDENGNRKKVVEKIVQISYAQNSREYKSGLRVKKTFGPHERRRYYFLPPSFWIWSEILKCNRTEQWREAVKAGGKNPNKEFINDPSYPKYDVDERAILNVKSSRPTALTTPGKQSLPPVVNAIDHNKNKNNNNKNSSSNFCSFPSGTPAESYSSITLSSDTADISLVQKLGYIALNDKSKGKNGFPDNADLARVYLDKISRGLLLSAKESAMVERIYKFNKVAPYKRESARRP